MLMGQDESEAQEAHYPHEIAAKDAEQRVAQLQGRKPPRHDANDMETLIRALMK